MAAITKGSCSLSLPLSKSAKPTLLLLVEIIPPAKITSSLSILLLLPLLSPWLANKLSVPWFKELPSNTSSILSLYFGITATLVLAAHANFSTHSKDLVPVTTQLFTLLIFTREFACFA